jgi:hypothetical protein
MSNEQETVTIPKSEYDQLRRDSIALECLEGSGVDNWDWYGDAMKECHARLAEEGLEE